MSGRFFDILNADWLFAKSFVADWLFLIFIQLASITESVCYAFKNFFSKRYLKSFWVFFTSTQILLFSLFFAVDFWLDSKFYSINAWIWGSVESIYGIWHSKTKAAHSEQEVWAGGWHSAGCGVKRVAEKAGWFGKAGTAQSIRLGAWAMRIWWFGGADKNAGLFASHFFP